MSRLKRRIEKLFNLAREAVNLINEKDGVWFLRLVRIAARSPARSIATPEVLFKRRFKRRGDEVGERRLPDPGRAVEENMLRHPAALLGGINSDAHIRLHLFLPHIFVPATGRSAASREEGREGDSSEGLT